MCIHYVITLFMLLQDKHGLEKVEVIDDGCGICRSDTSFMCLPNYTSKITDFSDLSKLKCIIKSSFIIRGQIDISIWPCVC